MTKAQFGVQGRRQVYQHWPPALAPHGQRRGVTDLRHGYVSIGAVGGESLVVIGAIVGHSAAGMTALRPPLGRSRASRCRPHQLDDRQCSERSRSHPHQ
jgi:hypothetical protein